jgi:hypothetical protein
MRLFMANIHLHRARLFHDRAALRKARALIEPCGYWRRREALADAEQAAATWPEPPPLTPPNVTNYNQPASLGPSQQAARTGAFDLDHPGVRYYGCHRTRRGAPKNALSFRTGRCAAPDLPTGFAYSRAGN